jgi:hypothetical protein
MEGSIKAKAPKKRKSATQDEGTSSDKPKKRASKPKAKKASDELGAWPDYLQDVRSCWIVFP